MKLIVGLGNPGKKYERTWHNLGWLTLEALAEFCETGKFKKSAKFQAEVTEITINGEKIILAKPQTFMNLSGESVATIASFYKIKPQDVIVIHDDIDLALGRIKISQDSASGGHNGIKSIIEKLGTKDFIRVKVGVKSLDEDKLKNMDTADYVLSGWNRNEKPIVTEQIKKAGEAALAIIESGIESAMNQYNKK
jgi:PTH1 family peptidyl-tRNA hydrolase